MVQISTSFMKNFTDLRKKHLENKFIKTVTLQVTSASTKNMLLKCGVNF